MDITELLAFSVENNASDLHLSTGTPPSIRVDGDVRKLNIPAFDEKDVNALVYDIMNDRQRKEYEEKLEVDFSFEVPNLARFRVNAFNQNRGPAAVFRTIPSEVLTLEQLGAPEIFKTISDNPRGLVLVTGPTGSGKSTTLAAMIDHLNSTRSLNIISLEDPIEFVHESKRSLINQREVHRDTLGFNEALRSALREDPDVILVGELRDAETISMAMTAAETGHLVLGTLHTTGAVKSIDRIIDALPGELREQTKGFLAMSLKAVVTQVLVKTPDGRGRRAVLEILVNTRAIAKLITSDQTHQIPSQLQTGKNLGMRLMDSALLDAINAKEIDPDDAIRFANDKKKFHRFVTDTDLIPTLESGMES